MKLHDRIDIDIEKRKEDNYGLNPSYCWKLKIGGVPIWRNCVFVSPNHNISEKEVESVAIESSGRFLVACGNYILRTQRKMKKRKLV